MTAPGNSALVISLLAVFVACVAYAIGRLHQRRQTDRDREDAYREGYDNATRSTLSLAAHLVVRRRAARPNADSTTDGPLPAKPKSAAAGPPLPAAFSEPPPPQPLSPRPAPALPGVSQPGVSSPGVSQPGVPSPGVSLPGVTLPGVSSPAVSPLPAAPGSTPRPTVRRSSPASEYDATSLGFPVPPPAPPQLIGEPAAFGGVVYRPFPDPRLVGAAEPLLADRGSLHGVPYPRPYPSGPVLPESNMGAGAEPSSTAAAGESMAGGSVSPAAVGGSVSPAAVGGSVSPTVGGGSVSPAAGGSASTGRHTVPDELVHSATYRLPADRVFRAKVPESTDRPALPEEPTTRIWLPKPRKS